jgi:hypothetical protein
MTDGAMTDGAMTDQETSRAEDALPDVELTDDQRRRLLALLPTAAAALMLRGEKAAADPADSPPRRALTGRDEAGSSVFKSFAVTPQVVNFESRPGLAFYELYATAGVPALDGHEPDPILTRRSSFPGPGATLFRMVRFPPHPPEGTSVETEAYRRYLDELSQKIPGMAEHFEREVPGMHTSQTLDYGIVIRGEIILELDDGRTAHLRQGDCVVQNGTRHRWRNPLPVPCLMAFVLIGGQRDG